MSASQAMTLQSTASPVALAIDRWIWVFMAVFFIAITLTGFIPDSMMKVAMVRAGARPPLPPILHVHAVLMGSFLLLLLAQSWLMATGRRDRHMMLGRIAFVLVPAMVIAGFILVPTMYRQVAHAAQVTPPPMQGQLQQLVLLLDDIALLQFTVGILFPICIWLALRARRTDPGFHKRMMFLATAIALPAAFDRIEWLPTTAPGSPLSSDLYILVAVSPMLLYDVIRNHSIPRVYWVWLALVLPVIIAGNLLWNTPGWHAFVSRLLG